MSPNAQNATLIYPPSKSDVPGSTRLRFNSIDTVNVSWTEDDPDYFLTRIVLCIGDYPACNDPFSNDISGMRSIMELMDKSTTYPYTARFNLRYMPVNGITDESALDTDDFEVYQDLGAKPVTWSAPNITASVDASFSPTTSLSTTGPSTPGPSTTGPSTTGPLTRGQSTTSLSTANTSAAASISAATPSSGLSSGAIAGIVVAGVIVWLLSLTIAGYFIWRRLNRRRTTPAQEDTSSGTLIGTEIEDTSISSRPGFYRAHSHANEMEAYPYANEVDARPHINEVEAQKIVRELES